MTSNGVGSKIWISREQLRTNIIKFGDREVYASYQLISDRSGRQQNANIFVPVGEVGLSGLADYFAVSTYATLYLLPNTSVAMLFASLDSHTEFDFDSCMESLVWMEAISSGLEAQSVLVPAAVDRFFKQIEGRIPSKWLAGRDRLIVAIRESLSELRVFNPLSWGQRGSQDGSLGILG